MNIFTSNYENKRESLIGHLLSYYIVLNSFNLKFYHFLRKRYSLVISKRKEEGIINLKSILVALTVALGLTISSYESVEQLDKTAMVSNFNTEEDDIFPPAH